MPNSLKFALGALLACLLASCAEQPQLSKRASATSSNRIQKVRTTAYTHTEKGGRRNAIGTHLSGRHVMSAACDWSRYPLGTRFRIVGGTAEYIIDDYGTALVGTNTIDLYKPSRLEMRRWGVRHVDIDILERGSRERSLEVLTPRKKHRLVRQMMAGLQRKNAGQSAPSAQAPARTSSLRTVD